QCFVLKRAGVPWYSPGLATLGAVLLVVALAQRRSIPRVIALLLITAFAGFQWIFLLSFTRLPAYDGPARAGKPIPAFSTTGADGTTFTDADLRDGSRH